MWPGWQHIPQALCRLCAGDGSRPEDNNLVGTPHYMSPELLSCKDYGFKTDVWWVLLCACATNMVTSRLSKACADADVYAHSVPTHQFRLCLREPVSWLKVAAVRQHACDTLGATERIMCKS